MSIECQGVSKRFGSTQALEGISLTLESGHIYGLLGNNGAGKSTLLSILTDRQLPDQGTVTIDGAPIRNNDRALEKEIAFVQYIEGHLEEAVSRGWIKVYYQPVVRPREFDTCNRKKVPRIQ